MNLYSVQIMIEAVVMAEDKFDAEDYVDQIIDNEYKSVCVSKIDHKNLKFSLPPGWSINTLIYHEGDKDLSVADAVDQLRE